MKRVRHQSCSIHVRCTNTTYMKPAFAWRFAFGGHIIRTCAEFHHMSCKSAFTISCAPVDSDCVGVAHVVHVSCMGSPDYPVAKSFRDVTFMKFPMLWFCPFTLL